MSPRVTLSACIITRDEQDRLPACLATLGCCDEVIVVDSESTDRTVALAEAAGARVVVHPWAGFAAQRNVALDLATGDWVLEIDADERVEPSLAAAMRAFLDDPALTAAHDMAMLPMRHRFLGRELSAAMQAPGYRPRLFRRDAYRHDEARTVHEGLAPNGPALPLDDGAMVHELAGSWGEALRDARSYARLEAAQYAGAVNAGAAARGVLVRPVAKAGYRLAIDGGWREGWPGIARIGLECWGDARTWTHLLREGRRPARDPSASRHIGMTKPRAGAVKVAGVAVGRAAADDAARWLGRAAAAGAEAVLVTSEAVTPPAGVRLRRASGERLLGLARAVDAEHQARALDGLLLAGPRVAARVRVARAAGVPRQALAEEPGQAVARMAARRP